MCGDGKAGSPPFGPEDPTRVPVPEDQFPRHIGRYRIDGVLGVGGFGTVYHGVHRWLGVAGAVKVMRRHLSEQMRGAFLREARRLAALRGHPAIAEIRDFGFFHDPSTGSRSPYFITDLVPGGRTLLKHARAEGLGIDQRLALFEQVCDGVRYAHELGVIHLDLKPANILVWPATPGRPARPRIIDFGVSRAADPGRESAHHEGRTGTPAYMSPEQTDPGAPLDARSDVYALGVVLYELLCDALPYKLDDRDSVATAEIIRGTPPDFDSARPRSLPTGVRRILQRALCKSPADRYDNAGEMLRALRMHFAGRPVGPQADSPLVHAAYALRRMMAAHPGMTRLAILVLAICAGQWIAVPLSTYTDATGWFTARFSRPSFDAFQHVVMIERTPATDAAAGLDIGAPKVAFREHYVTLMKVLKDARPRAVVFDIIFAGGNTEADGEFARTAETLRAQGIPVIVGLHPEAPNDVEFPPSDYLNRTIRAGITSWGDVGVEDELYPWTVALATHHGGPHDVESLVMTTLRALSALEVYPSNPDQLIPNYIFDLTNDRLIMEFYRRGTQPGTRLPLVPAREPNSYRVTGVRYVPSQPVRLTPSGQRALDTVALVIARPPARRVFDEATVAMERFLKGPPDPAALQRCHDAVVLIHYPAGETKPPYHPTESFAGGHVHAAALETMLRGSILRMPDYWDEWAILTFGAGLGLILPRPYMRRRSWWPRWAVAAAIAAWIAAITGIVGGAIVAGLSCNYVVNPLVVLCGMIVAAGLSIAGARLSRFQGSFVASVPATRGTSR